METNYKTLVPAVVGLGILVYESLTGHKVDADMQTQIVNGSITAIGFVITAWGIWKNHKKDVQK